MDEVILDDLKEEVGPHQRAIPCHVCNSNVFDLLLDAEAVALERSWMRDFYKRHTEEPEVKDQTEFTQFEDVNIVACQTCGTLHRNPQPTPQEIERRYQVDNYGDDVLAKLLAHELPFFEAKSELLKPFLPRNASIIEVGSFVGAFMDVAQSLGWDVVGLDLGQETSDFCRRRGLDVRREELSCSGRVSSDAVCIWNTFDQLADPSSTLRQAWSALKPGGTLVIRVPNGAFKAAAVQRRNARPRSAERVMAAELFNNHLTFPYLTGYTPSSLSGLLASHGFVAREILGDTILPLVDPEEHPSLAEQERRYKRRLTAISDRLSAKGKPLHPWIDVIATRNPSD